MPNTTFSTTTLAEQLDPFFHAALSRQMGSLSRAGLLQAGSDWAMHLAASPGKCLDLVRLALHQNTEMLQYAQACMAHGFAPHGTDAVPVPVQDRRFADPLWQRWPYNAMSQSFLLTEKWWDAATHGVWGVEKHHEDVVAFTDCECCHMVQIKTPDLGGIHNVVESVLYCNLQGLEAYRAVPATRPTSRRAPASTWRWPPGRCACWSSPAWASTRA